MLNTRILKPTDEARSTPLLIKNLLLSGQRYERTQEIIYRDISRYDYVTFNERVCRLANALTKAGVKAGDTVAMMDWDSHRYLECMFAVPMLGAVMHTINVRLSPDQILYTMNHAEDVVVLVNSEFVPIYKAIENDLTTVTTTILLTDEESKVADLPGLAGEYEQLLAAAEPTYEFADFDENSVATTFYTTGTTGNPKGVYFTHRQLVLHTLSQVASLSGLDSVRQLGNRDVYMPITPMFHVHAWGIPYTATLMGVKQVYPGRYEPEMLVKLIKDHGVTFSHCVPTILQMVLKAEGAKDHDFGGMRVIIGGSALNRSLFDLAKSKGMHLGAAYGMSETCPLISAGYVNLELEAGSEDDRISHLIKAGVPGPLVEAKIMAPDGSFLPNDGKTQGELVLRAPWLTQAYFREPEKSKELWAGGWMHTGDVATIDPMGFIDIRDRIKDVIKTGGEWLSSLELEDLISRSASVSDVAVVGIPDPRWDERPFALVVAAPGQQVTAASLCEHLQPFVDDGRINKWAIPTQIAVVSDIPKTSVGKLDKKRIRTEIAQWIESGDDCISSL
ncbi:fatty acid--CoA ligase [Pseudomonas neustonica]|uniref:Fatty acid--CoA ligase n=1 Tax=Pseudomonas neustonica TaxID=2487346 RepID=A0ABX9XP01_9PSED|nr:MULTISPECIES: fatty acid--CoA ligase [Pseudomonas]MAB24495.1 long-chain fatty acid--CoA ligase [Pseudomonadales bacterium]ROZ85550.1 fatty acid--CoA ligase [Pseudomonas sp. SSM44]ROZ87556.1 fatty acid--CoA ligase [Pseudomonas neustonica]|tara:strand:+ start:1355 stop:3037 length:1683 start_codon:yes stop_codon:yes gene_type:complete